MIFSNFNKTSFQLTGALLLVVFLGATAVIYWPGLQSVFLLDDVPNLNVLNQVSETANLSDIILLAGEGFAGILGRPLSILSFLSQASTWPDPYYFKLANLLLHLLNGILLYLVVGRIIAYSGLEFGSRYAALFVALLWLLHPLQVSTVLYVVQRMTMLSTFFILLGIYCYLIGREKLQNSGSISAAALMLGAPYMGVLFAVFSKENGVLIFAYLAALELTLLSNQNLSARTTKIRALSVYLPMALGAAAFLILSPSLIAGYDLKPFDMVQRLVTQPAVLTAYLTQILIPLPTHLGLYHDDFPIFSHPLENTLAILGWVVTGGLFLLAILKRKQWRCFAFAVLWFLAGHSLESTVLPLEMYFEHRNYLPMLGPLFAVVYGLSKLAMPSVLTGPHSISAASKAPLQALMVAVIIMICGVITWTQTRLWAEPMNQAEVWYRNSPDSELAQGNLVTILSNSGQSELAFNYHQQFTDPEAPLITDIIRWLEFKCILPEIALPEDTVLEQSTRNAVHDYSTIYLLNNLSTGVLQGSCNWLPAGKLSLVMAGLLANTNYSVSYPDLYQLYALVQASQGDVTGAAELASLSYQLRPDIDVALYRIAWLAQADRMKTARDELASVESNLSALQRTNNRLIDRINRLHSLLGN